MASTEMTETCSEHKIPVADDYYQKAKRLQRTQWLRAAILAGNDGLLSTASVMLGVGAVKEDSRSMVLSGLVGALAGACSMAVGEFVSVSTQNIEKATSSRCSSKDYEQGAPGIKLDITLTAASIKEETKLSVANLAGTHSEDHIHRGKFISEPTERVSPSANLETKLPPGVSPGRCPSMNVITEDAKRSAKSLEEDYIEEVLANPYKASAASGFAFLCGSFVPLVPAILVSQNIVRIAVIALVTSIAPAFFGGFGAHLGGSSIRISAARVLVGGWIAMAMTYGLLKPFNRDHRDSSDKD